MPTVTARRSSPHRTRARARKTHALARERTRSDGSGGGRKWTGRSPDCTDPFPCPPRSLLLRPPPAGGEQGGRATCPQGAKPAAEGRSWRRRRRAAQAGPKRRPKQAMAGGSTILPPSLSRPRLPPADPRFIHAAVLQLVVVVDSVSGREKGGVTTVPPSNRCDYASFLLRLGDATPSCLKRGGSRRRL